MSDTAAFVYLAGAIDLAPDLGGGWRGQITDFLQARGCEVADPAQMQASVLGLEVKALIALRGTDEERCKQQTRRVIEHDLGFVAERATCIVAMVDEHARMGTYAELAIAFLNGVPIFIICPDRARLSGWALSCADAVFERLQDLLEWLSNDSAPDAPLPERLMRRRAEGRSRRRPCVPKVHGN